MAADLKLRIGIGSNGRPKSAVWNFFTTGNELYACHRSMGAIQKLSFHSSRICREAFVQTHGVPSTMSDRVIHRRIRDLTPPTGSGKAVFVLGIVFPTAQLSDDLPPIAKQTHWLSAAPTGKGRVVLAVFTNDDKNALASALAPGMTIVAHHQLPNHERVAILEFEQIWEGNELVAPATIEGQKDYVFPHAPIPTLTRDVYFTMSRVDEYMRCLEFTGYSFPAGEGAKLFPGADLFSRTKVLDKKGPKAELTTP